MAGEGVGMAAGVEMAGLGEELELARTLGAERGFMGDGSRTYWGVDMASGSGAVVRVFVKRDTGWRQEVSRKA